MRLFLAINLPAEVRRDIHAATEPLRAAAPTLAWVREPLLHFTVKFLGEQPESVLEPLRQTLSSVALRYRAMLLQLAGIGAFPNFRRARTVWMGVAPEPRLELLHHDIEMALAVLGFEAEGRPFRPHLTLARVKHSSEPVLRALAAAAKQVRFATTVEVLSVDLMKSDLLPDGPQFAVVSTAPLRSS